MRTTPSMEMEFFLDGDDASDLFLHDPQREDESKAAVREESPARTQSRSSVIRPAAGTRDAFHIYLQDIRGLDLLTHEEEIELAQRAAAGDWLARCKLIESNLRLVIAVARRYARAGVLLVDLIQAGNLGLMQAVDKFDYERGSRLSTYATMWIQQAICRDVGAQLHVIHLPEHVSMRLRRIRRISARLVSENGIDPPPEQIAAACHMTVNEVVDLLSVIEQPVSLEAVVNVNDEAVGSFADKLEDSTTTTPAESATRDLLGEELQRAFALLTPREQTVIALRFGIGDGYSHTLSQIGKKLGVTRERIRQLEGGALMKLRALLDQASVEKHLSRATPFASANSDPASGSSISAVAPASIV
jgi:RNA polymerase primary sigma factor